MDDRSHERARREIDGRVASRSASTVFAAGIDSPVSTRLVALELVDLDQPQVGRHQVARLAGATTSPGTRSRDVDALAGVPSRHTRVSWWMLACSAATATSERYSLTNPSPTLRTHDRGDDPAVDGVAGGRGHRGRGRAAGSGAGCGADGAARRTPSPDARPGRCAPNVSQSDRGLLGGEALLGATQGLQHIGHGAARGAPQIEISGSGWRRDREMAHACSARPVTDRPDLITRTSTRRRRALIMHVPKSQPGARILARAKRPESGLSCRNVGPSALLAAGDAVPP